MKSQILTTLFLLLPVITLAADPQLNVITPRGIQRGADTVVTFHGARLSDAEEIFFYEPGFEVIDVRAVEGNANITQVTVRVAPDCELGEHTAQVRTKSGISDFRSFFVGALPVVNEAEPNTEFAQAQPIEQNVTVHGIVTPEDVDYFAVECKKGQRLSLEVEAMRLGEAFFDPYIAILDEKRFELSAADDSPLVKQDAVTSVIIPEDGRYVIEMRDSGYGGAGNARYCLHVGQFPRSTVVYPAGGEVGQAVEFTFLGDAVGATKKMITLPAEPGELPVWPEDEQGIAPTAHVLRVSTDPNALEAEPNNSLDAASEVDFPATFNGILSEPGDVDCFRFQAKKGQVYDVECFGRRVRSPIDPVMYLYKADNTVIASNDDSRGPDSYIQFTIPEDGEYKLLITDVLKSGGPEFVYRIEFLPVSPSLTLGIPRVARYQQARQRVAVPKGGRFATVITAARTNFGGALTLDEIALPEGVTIVAQDMPASMNSMPVVFEAASDAPSVGSLVDFRARLKSDDQSISGRFVNRADYTISGPGQSLYVWKDVERLPVAVVDALPFAIEIVQPAVPIVRDGSMQLKIVAKKDEGWDEDITVEFPFRPPGIGTTPSIKIPKGQTEALYPLSANGNAALGTWPVFALGYSNVGGTAWNASQMATLEIAEPWVSLALQKSSVEQGQQTEIVAEVQVLKELTAPAQVQLVGLPHHVSSTPLEITADTKELVFPVMTQADSPAGTHKNLFCQVVVTENSEPIVHARVGSTELRVDQPLPEPVAPAPMPAPAAKPEEPKPAETPPEKRLTRLEKLRLETKQRLSGDVTQE